MNLQQRIDIFNTLTGKFPCYRPHPLICVIKTGLAHHIEFAAYSYLRRSVSFNGWKKISDDLSGLLDETYQWARDYSVTGFKVITPNGMVVPKQESMLEFNILARSFYGIINDLGIDDLIHSWNIPLNLRLKTGILPPGHLEKKNASEHIHSDAWAGEQLNCGTAMLIIGGDTLLNGIEFYVPPDDFSEEWLKTTDAGYVDKGDIIAKCRKLSLKLQVGDLVLSDFATLHASQKPTPLSRPRLSIDSVFAYKCPENEKTHFRGLHATPHELKDIGREMLLYTKAGVEDQIDSQGGFKQAAAVEMKVLH